MSKSQSYHAHSFDESFSEEDTLGQEYCSLIQRELEQLNQIYEHMPSNQNFDDHFHHMFPKECPQCGKVYYNRHDYLLQTTTPGDGALIFDHEGLKELRICSCGHGMTLWNEEGDRRDCSYLGFLRRVLFDNCLRKISSEHPHIPKDTLKDYLRFYFRK